MADQPIFKALLPSMTALQMWGGITLFCGYDSDDPVWRSAAARESVGHGVCWVKLHALHGNLTGIWNWMARSIPPFDYLIPANDDLAFQTSPIPAAETIAARDGFGTVAFHDDAFPGLPTFYMVGRRHFDIFDVLYPLPWPGAHQDSWIADVYRPWKASEMDQRFRCHNHIGAPTRFEYGEAKGYREAVMSGRRRVRDYRREQISDGELAAVPLCIGESLTA